VLRRLPQGPPDALAYGKNAAAEEKSPLIYKMSGLWREQKLAESIQQV
jgi:hypothetical protein